MQLRSTEQALEDSPESRVAELAPATGEKDRRPVVQIVKPRTTLRIDLRPLASDIPPQLFAGLGRAPYRFVLRVFTLVAHKRRDVDANLRILCSTQTTSGQRKDLRHACATLQQKAQNDCLTRRRMVDHVPHAGQDRQPRRLCVACNGGL